MAAESVLARIVDNPKLPTPPALTLRVLEHANRPNCSISEIGKLISHDPALCGRMLRLVNSSLYGLQRSVTSIDRALNLLGLNHVRSLVLSLSLPTLRFHSTSTERMMQYWKNSVTIAIVCREMATRLRWPDPDSEMVAGLLCDFGVLLLHETFPEQAARLVEGADDWFARQCAAEADQFEVDHAQAGAHFLKHWRLGDDLTEAIRFHHHPHDAPAPFVDRATLLWFGSCVAQLFHSTRQASLLSEILRLGEVHYRLDRDHLLTFLESLNPKIAEFAALIDLDMGERQSFATLFAQSTENLARLAAEASLDNVRIQVEKSLTERQLHEAKQALQHSERELWHAQKIDSIGRLAGGIAHDFNNLLTVINGSCELVREMACLDHDARELVEMIHESGKRAADLTQQLLAFSRKQRMTSAITSLNAIVTDMTKLLERVLGKDVALTIRLAADLAPVQVDSGQMEQVILNLAVNARDAMPNGGSLTIETVNLELEPNCTGNPEVQPGTYAVLSVRDTGQGMDEAVQKKIFEPFFTTKEQGKGTGLGLATVHGIVRQSGGHISVASTVGTGTVFHIYLPAARETVAVAAPATPSAAAAETILLADDEESMREFTERLLAMQGYQVLTACDGAEALQVSDHFANTIHLLISDQLMPKMTGAELIQQMRQRRPGIKTILYSGLCNVDGIVSQSSTPFLQKPFGSKELLSIVGEVLGNAGGPMS